MVEGSIMKFVIQKGIPIPQKFSVPPMEIGDSFVAPMKKRSKIYTLFKRDFPQYSILTTRLDDEDVRVWRVG
jgi:hypothetical protein